jgi:chromosome segregation ATPase
LKPRKKRSADRIEQGVTTVYNHIPESAQAENTSAEEKLKLISKTIEHYRQEIEELKEKLTPTTPPEVREQRKQEVALQMEAMEEQVSATTGLFDRATQLWTTLDEDEQVQQWDQEEERLSVAMQELKNRQKMMSITERLKGNQDMKKLQADLNATQRQKHERQEEVEPLQEKVVQLIVQLEEEKRNMEQAQTEGTTLIQEEITMQSVEALTGRVMQVQARGRELADKFHSLAEVVQGVHNA